MKRILFIVISILLTKLMFGQLIQNPDFENWQVNNYFEYPEEWMIINEDENTNLLAHKVTGNAQLDDYSIKLNTIDYNNDILFGLMVYGDPGDGGNFKGFPFDKTGNMFHFWYKANIQPGDMGMMMLILWNNGVRIDSIVYPILNSQANWTHAQFPVNASLIQPDSMFLAVLSSVPVDFGGNPVAGTWIQLDNLYFTNGMDPTPLTVPNYSFENWGMASAQDPVSWTTSNGEFELVMSDSANVTKYTDSYSGSFAALLTNVVLNGKIFSAEMRYNDNFNVQPEKMFVAYKYVPNGQDTAHIGVNFFNNGNHVGGAWYDIFDNQANYIVAELSLFYMDVPDEIEVFIMSGNNPNTILLVDDIRFSCTLPSNLFGEFVSASSIEATWNTGGAETQWQLEWGISGFNQGNGTIELINNTPEFLINGISNSNNYDLYVRSICSVGDTSNWMGPFTVCSAVNIPVNANFEGLNNGDIPQCWNKIQTGNTYIGADDMFGVANTGQKYLKMNFNQPNNAIFVSPQIQEPLNSLYISFYATKNNWVNQAQLLLGTMANPSDPASFVVEKVIDLTNNYIQYEHYFDTYLGTDNYIAIKLTTNDFGAEIFIDDLIIDFIPLCPSPQNLIVNTITINSAHVQWDAGSENLWNLKYGLMDFDPNTSGVSVNGLTNPEYDLSSLNPGTTYDVYVQADCGVDGTSNWTKYSFTTLCVAYSIPLFESFEGTYLDELPNCWSNNIQGWGMVYVVPWGGYNTQSATNMRINNNMDSVYLITPQFVQNLNELYITFWAYEYTQSNAELTLGTMSNPTDINTFTPLQNIVINDFYQMFTYYFNNYTGTDHYIAFKLKTNSNQYTEIFIDDISVKTIPTCFTPQNINAVNITANSADITWQQGNNENLWNLIYVPSTQNPFDNGQKITGINTTQYTLQGLSSNYMYDVYVQSDCGGADTSEWSMAYTFTTLCDPFIAPYSENFDLIPEWQIPQCWKSYVIHNDLNAYAGLQNFNPYSNPNHILMFNSSMVDPGAIIMMVTPELSDVSDKQISFWAKASSDNTTLNIGYLMNQNMPNSFVQFTSVILNSNYEFYTIPLSSLTGNKYIAFSHGQPGTGNSLGILIDDFIFEGLPTCPKPQNFNIINLTQTSAQFVWDAGGSETLWNTELGNQGFTPGNSEYIYESTGSTTNMWSVSNLSPNTTYQVYVQADCGSGDLSEWQGPLTFTTPCDVYALPFIQDFNLLFPPAIPACWQKNVNNWQSAMTNNAGGSMPELMFNWDPQVIGKSTIMTPAIDATNVSTLLLSFKHALIHYNAMPYSLNVEITTDGNNWTNIWSLIPSGDISSQTVEINLNTYAGNMIRLAWVFDGDSWDTDRWFIDDINVDQEPICIKPTGLFADNISTTTANLNWSAGGAETLWDIEVGYTGFTPGSSNEITGETGTNNNPWSATNLTPNTSYQFYVRADCGSGDLSNWAGPYNFTTACPVYQLPYIENFENPLECWSTDDEDGFNPIWERSANFNHTTAGFYSGYHQWGDPGQNQTGWYITPQIELPIASIELSFWHYNTYPDFYGSNSVHITTDGINYQQLWHPTNVNQNWVKEIVSLSAYAGQIIQLAFKYEGDDAHGWYIDDILIEETNCPSPTSLAVSNITTNGATLTWVAGNTENTWNVELYDVNNLLVAANTISNNPTWTVASLQPNAKYYFYVQADCGGVTSSWAGPLIFNTPCEAFANPFSENFDATPIQMMPDCWNRIINSNYYRRVEVSNNIFYSAPNSLILWNGNTPDSGVELLAITPQLTALNQYQLRFYARTNVQTTPLLFGTITDPANPASFTLLETINLSNVYEEFYVPLSNYSGADTYLCFKHPSADLGNDIYISVDDFVLEPMDACPAPSQLNATNITSTTALLGWTESGTASSWQIQYGLQGFMFGFGTYELASTNPSHNINQLLANKIYEFYVRSICGPGDTSSWSSVYSFTTGCGLVTYPFTENFDNSTFEQMPVCWNRIVNHSDDAFVGVHNYMNPLSLPYHLLLWNGNIPDANAEMIAVTPEVADLNQYQVRFFAKDEYNYSHLEVGTMSNPNDASTFNLLQSIQLTGYYQEYLLQLSSYTGSDTYIAFRHGNPHAGNNQTIAIDNFVFEPLESCPKPTQLSAVSVTSTSVNLTWTENGSATNWQIEWGNQGFLLGEGINFFVTTPQHLFHSLMPLNNYDVYVRSVCGPGDTSTWSNPFTFFTDLVCIDNTVHSQPVTPIQYVLWSSQEYDRKVHQNFAGVSSVFDGLHLWGRLHNTTEECYSAPIDLEVTFYNDNNGNIGTPVTSFIVHVTPDSLVNNGEQYYEFTIQFPEVIQLTEGWFSVQSVNSPSCYLLLAASSNSNTYGRVLRVQNQGADTLIYSPLGYCFLNNTHVVTYLAGQGGTIVGQSTQYVVDGGSTTPVTADPDDCYQFIRWSDVIPDNPRHDVQINNDFSVTAIFAPVVSSNFITEEICQGDTFFFGSQILVSAGDYQELYQDVQGCDSIVYLTLFVNPTYEFVEAAQICMGDTFNWHGNSYTLAGTYFDSLQTINGCDSVYILQLLLNPKYEINNYGTICDGEFFNWRGNTYTVQGVYYDSLQSIYGCDSTFMLNLTVNPSYEFLHTQNICIGETFNWRGDDYSAQGIYYDSLLTILNCDSVYVLNLIVNPKYLFNESAEICNGDLLNWHGVNYSLQGIYYDSLLTTEGCDSVFVLDLTVHPTFEFIDTIEICDGESYNWRGNDYTIQGIYFDSLLTQFNCDSVYILQLTVHPIHEFIQNHSICDGSTYYWHGNYYGTQGTYYDSLLTVFGCDSVYVLNLTVNPVYEFPEFASVCNGDMYSWRGNNYSVTGTYFDSLSTSLGCDSLFVLNLTVNPTYEIELYDTICEGEQYVWRGNTFTLEGTYYDSLQTTLGCDSIYVLILEIFDVDVSLIHNSITLTAGANGATFQWVDCDSNFAVINGATSNIYTAIANGNYAVIVTQNNCVDTSDCYTVNDVFVLDNKNDIEYRIYPNPNNGQFNLYLTEKASITVYNTLSELIFETVFEQGTHEMSFNHLSGGVYYFNLKGNNFNSHIKVIIQK